MPVLNVRCHRELAQRLAVGVHAARTVEKEWLKKRRTQVAQRVRDEELTVAYRDVLLDEIADTFAAMRASGTFRGTRTLFVLPSLREVLAERGWTDRTWKPVPRRARAGRPWG